MKRRNVVAGGAAVTVVALLASWISGLFTGGGGEGNGNGGRENGQAVQTSGDETGQQPSEPERSTTGAGAGDVPPEDGVLDVWIEDRQFAIRGGANPRESESTQRTAVPLETVVERARETVGNEDGIRVRIFRAASSRASAEQALKDALEAAGFSEHSLRWASGDPGE